MIEFTLDHGRRRSQVRPIRRTSRKRASFSRLASGNARKRLMRRSIVAKASRKARSNTSGASPANPGSGNPQCAVTGRPGQMGHGSLAALSHSVKTKSILGASGPANSSQLLLRRPVSGKPALSICRSACGFTMPTGWLPALYEAKCGAPLCFKTASAMMERDEFPVQRKRTFLAPATFSSLPLPRSRSMKERSTIEFGQFWPGLAFLRG